MNKIEQAKKLLRKAIILDDAELMAMANEILGEVTTSPEVAVEPAPAPAPVPVPEQPKEIKRETDFDSFKMNNSEDLSRKNGVAVNRINREIQFVDDGSDKDIKTPEITLADRSKRKPFKKIEQNCQKCGRTVKTHPSHKREWFICDGCIRK